MPRRILGPSLGIQSTDHGRRQDFYHVNAGMTQLMPQTLAIGMQSGFSSTINGIFRGGSDAQVGGDVD